MGNKKNSNGKWSSSKTYIRKTKFSALALFNSSPWFWLLCATSALLLLWWLVLFARVLAHKKVASTAGVEHDLPPVSVIVVAKNEYQNLQALLPKLLQQKYDSDFEVIVVNDQSWDKSEDYISDLKSQHQNLQLVTIGEHLQTQPGKKLGITLGVKKSSYEHILLTDADCLPKTDHWIQTMATGFAKGKDIVIGFSPHKLKGSLLNAFIEFETYQTLLHYAAFALAKLPYMSVGRNWGYSKQLFFENKGFANQVKIAFGDDDLLLQRMATGKNVALVIDEEAQMESEAKSSVKAWFKQKRRHLSAGKFYKFKFKALLGFLWLSQLSYLAAVAIYFVFHYKSISWLGIAATALPALLYTITAAVLQNKFKAYKRWYLYIILTPIYQVIIQPIFSLSAFIKPRKKW